MQILTIAGYKFIALDNLEILRQHFLNECVNLGIKGTILISHEGINLNISGEIENIQSFIGKLKQDKRFTDITFHETVSGIIPFQRLKIKLKNEIITMRQPEVNVVEKRAPDISPVELKQWLDEKRDITLLDSRNNYETRFGTFKGALNLELNNFGDFGDFGELADAIENIDRNKALVMFCTGGIRCEKAAIYMLNQGFSNVYQLNGGILGYFAQVGGAHYEGECFVFDERVAVDANLQHTGTIQCRVCQGPVSKAQQELESYVPGVSCHGCVH